MKNYQIEYSNEHLEEENRNVVIYRVREGLGHAGRVLDKFETEEEAQEFVDDLKQAEVYAFFETTANECHYLNEKPVKEWDEYDRANWNSLNAPFEKIIDERKKTLREKQSDAQINFNHTAVCKPTAWEDAPEIEIAGFGLLPRYQAEHVYGIKHSDPYELFTIDPPTWFILENSDGHSYVINTEGFDYARYVGRLKPEGLTEEEKAEVHEEAKLDASYSLAGDIVNLIEARNDRLKKKPFTIQERFEIIENAIEEAGTRAMEVIN